MISITSGPGGRLHSGIDFNYVGGPDTNPGNQFAVYAPITGIIIETQPNYGGVIVQAPDETYHRILHLDSMELGIEKGAPVIAGVTRLGTMGNLGVQAPGQHSGGVHVHYDVYLESNGIPGWQAPIGGVDQDLRIDPIVYWTQGINPNATPTSTGLTILVTPINDLPANGLSGPGDGTISQATINGITASENARILKEGQSSFLKVGVNTPHTRDIVLRLRFDQATPNLEVRGEGVDWQLLAQTAYITLSATTSQSAPNTSRLIELHFNEDDHNTTNEYFTYTVDAGYLEAGSFVPYNQTSTVFRSGPQ